MNDKDKIIHDLAMLYLKELDIDSYNPLCLYSEYYKIFNEIKDAITEFHSTEYQEKIAKEDEYIKKLLEDI